MSVQSNEPLNFLAIFGDWANQSHPVGLIVHESSSDIAGLRPLTSASAQMAIPVLAELAKAVLSKYPAVGRLTQRSTQERLRLRKIVSLLEGMP